MAWQETNVLRGWLLKHPTFAKLFRQQVGGFFGGSVVKKWSTFEKNSSGQTVEIKWVTLRQAQFIPVGAVGLPDYGGWRSKMVTQDMVGHPVAIYVGMEGKFEDGALRPEQKVMLHNIRKDGGIAFVVRNEDTVPPDWEPQS